MRSLIFIVASVACVGACDIDWDRLEPAQQPVTARGGNGGDGGNGTGATAGRGGATAGGMGGAGATGGAEGGAGGSGGQGGSEPLGPWSTPQLVANINSGSYDDDPSFTGDMLELFFNSSRGGDGDIWVSTRATSADPWGTPTAVAELNEVGTDTNPVIAPDGLTIWFASSRATQLQNGADIYVATRPSRQDAWITPAVALGLSMDAINEYPGSVSADTLAMVMERGGDLYWTTRTTTTSPWLAPVPIAELNTASSERQAWLAPDRLSLFFDSNALGTTDIYASTRATTVDTWGSPAPIVELNTMAAGESDAWLSQDQRYIMFAQSTGAGLSDIYESSR